MYSELLFRRFFVAKKTATKKQLQSSRVMAALLASKPTLKQVTVLRMLHVLRG